MLSRKWPLAVPRLPQLIRCTLGVLLVYCSCTVQVYRAAAASPVEETSSIRRDVDAVCDRVRTHYAYYETRADIWDEACDTARAEAENALSETPSGHLALLEKLLDQLYDNHVSLDTNSAVSPRLVPSGSDCWLDFRTGVAVVTAVRPGSGAAAAGLAVGDVVLSLNGEPVLVSAMRRITAGRSRVSQTRLEWAMNAQMAGYRGAPRVVQVLRGDERLDLDLGEPEPQQRALPVTSARLDGNIGYIRFEDSLGRQETIAAFDAALDALRGVDGWIIDLRNTPGGGNTSVAEPILGRFISGVKAYQRSGPRWHGARTRYVASRGPWRVRRRVVVLAGRWTGSMGEGMAIGFDGLRRAEVFGSSMAGLAGGVESFELPGGGMQLRLPAYNLSHLRGLDRHVWRPPHAVIADNGDAADLALAAALQWLSRR